MVTGRACGWNGAREATGDPIRMKLTSRKPLVFTLLSAAGLVAIASCSDDTSGPLIPRAGYIAIAPSFNSNAASIIDVAIVAILLERTADGSTVLDTAIALELGTDSVDISLTVPILSSDDTFLLTLSLIDTAGDTVFRGEPQTVTPSLTGGADAPAVIVPLFYTGVGSNAAALAFLTANPTVFFGDSVELTAVALDSAGQVIANTPISFTSLDTLKATVPDKAVGIVVGGLARGEVSIEAKLLTDQSDTVVVTVQPVPSALLLTSGDGQTGTVGGVLADSLVVRVIAADSLGVAGVVVLFSSADTNASLSPDTVTTDAQGLAAVSWTLGTVAGGQQVIAAVSGTADTVSFTAIALTVVANGGFESGDFTGWIPFDSGSGNFLVDSGTTTPLSGFGVLPPPEGTWAAITDQGGPGTHIIYQDVFIPTSGTTAFSAIVYLENRAGVFIVDSVVGLRHDSLPNQHFRVDIMDPSAPVDDVGSGVLLNVFLTQPGDATSLPYTTLTADLTPFAGQTIRLRFAEVDNQFFFHVGVDAVSVTTSGSGAPLLVTPPPSAPGRRHAPTPAPDAPRYRRHR